MFILRQTWPQLTVNIYIKNVRTQWLMPIILAPGRLRQDVEWPWIWDYSGPIVNSRPAWATMWTLASKHKNYKKKKKKEKLIWGSYILFPLLRVPGWKRFGHSELWKWEWPFFHSSTVDQKFIKWMSQKDQLWCNHTYVFCFVSLDTLCSWCIFCNKNFRIFHRQ